MSTEMSAADRHNARELEWMTPEDRAQGELALGALHALRKTFEHWMIIAKFVYRMRQLADEKGGRKTFVRLLEQNGFGSREIEEIGGKATLTRLVQIAEHEMEVREWHYALRRDEQLKWAAPTTIFKHSSVFHKGEDGVTGMPSAGRRQRLETVQTLKGALEAATERIKELEQEKQQSDGSLFDLRRDSVDEIATTIVGSVSAHKAETLARRILKLLKDAKQPAG
jgi:hypothetical protein